MRSIRLLCLALLIPCCSSGESTPLADAGTPAGADAAAPGLDAAAVLPMDASAGPSDASAGAPDASAPTSDAGDAGAVIADAGGPGPVCLWNAEISDPPRSLAPDQGEHGFLACARLTPATYPFEVHSVIYQLIHGEAGNVMCDALLPHRVEVYVATTLTPPSLQPTVTLEVPAGDASEVNDVSRTVSQDLPTPLTLVEGEHLFVAVELAGAESGVVCLGANTTAASEASRNYWSGAATPPYPWMTLSQLGLNGSLIVGACDTSLAP